MANNTSAGSFDDCTDVSLSCPVEATVLGYYPDLGANVFFAAWFAAFGLAQLYLGIRYRTWTYMIATVCGCLTEVIGYIGRIMMHSNPWSDGFTIQITCLIIAPAFLSAAVYLTLKHIVTAFGEQYSPLQPKWYTYVFITCDLISLVVQGVGGGIAASAEGGSSASDLGGYLMLGGIVWQVITLAVFAGLVALYVVRLARNRGGWSSKSEAYRNTLAFKLFGVGVFVAFWSIMIRCIYRIPEQAGGWGNSLQRDELGFIVLEGAFISIAIAAQTFFHPGFGFPQMVPGTQQFEDDLEKKTVDSLNDQSVMPAHA